MAALLTTFAPSFRMVACLWPFASLVLTLPILALLYHRDGRLRAQTVLASYLVVLYLLALVCFTLYPLPTGTAGPGITYGIAPQLSPLGFVGDIHRDGMRAVFQIAANVAFFVPLGVAIGRGLYWRLSRTLAVGLGASLLIETAQLTGLFGLYPFAYRTFDVCDLMWNVSGAGIGWVLAWRLNRALPPREMSLTEPTRRPTLLRRGVALSLDLVLATTVALALDLLIRFKTQTIYGFDCDTRAILPSIQLLTFVILWLVFPVLFGGCTPGGAFVRMSCDTVGRSGWRLVAFLCARVVTLAACLLFPPATVATLIWYALHRNMPYDVAFTGGAEVPGVAPAKKNHGSGAPVPPAGAEGLVA